ncbi:MAG TPA: UpxY family transcription antiterminator [Bryobacteraceae bacterium]|nr:UpxY family transcription antiterminator [Bryobacteraceae bacterium]
MLANQPQWFALTVKPNHEKAAAQALQSRSLEVFLPLYRARRRWSDRIKELELPLFAGYVFCRFPGSQRARALATPGVTSVVGFGNKPAAVPEAEINSVRTLVSSGLPLSPWPFLRVGERVRIEAGPLAGVEGILSQVKDAWRVVVNVEILQRSVAAEVERDVVAAVRAGGRGGYAAAGKGPGSQHAGS